MLRVISRGLRSRSWKVRGAWLIGILVATLLILQLAAVVSDLPPGYGWKQWDSAIRLYSRQAEWEDLHRGTARDILRYIPIYLLWGLVVACVVASPRSRKRANDGHRLRRFALAPGALFVALIGTAVADLIETVLFRISLGRFLDGAGPEAVKGIAGLTRVLFALKAMGAVTALGLLLVLALYAHPPDLAGDG